MSLTNTLLKDKLKAFSLHFFISLGIAVLMFVLVFYLLYPSPLGKSADVLPVFLMMLGIDVVLGPLFTFIVFKKGKKTLKFDLAVIALVQITALCYGLHSLYIARPAFAVFEDEYFLLVNANDVIELESDTTTYKYNKLKNYGIEIVSASLSDVDADDVMNFVKDNALNGDRIEYRPEFYKPLSRAAKLIEEKAESLDKLSEYNEVAEVELVLDKYPEADAFLPLKASIEDMTVLINKKEGGTVVKIVDLRPWK